jgi:PKD repeat protein
MKRLLYSLTALTFLMFHYIVVNAQSYNMPASGSISQTTCSGNFYDSGGPAGQYGMFENGTITFYPATAGAKVKLTFNTLDFDPTFGGYLDIYNGVGTSSFIYELAFNEPAGYTVTSSDATGALTLVFTSGMYQANGWDATISCTLPSINISDGSIATVSDANFYDSGGPSGYYSDYEDYTMTVFPSSGSLRIRAQFSEFNTESCCDHLYVYDGTSTAAPLMGDFVGSSIPPDLLASNVDGALTFRFHSDYSGNSSGWAAHLTAVDPATLPPSCVGAKYPMDGNINVPLNTVFKWNLSPLATSYKAYLFDFNTSTLLDSITTTADSGSFSYTLQYGTHYYWRIEPKNANGSALGCYNNSFMSLDPPYINLTYNYTGAYWISKTNYIFGWYYSAVPGVNIYYTLDNGSTWNPIVSNYLQNVGNTNNSYSWTIPASIVGTYTQSRILITNSDASITDTSELFTISNIPPIVFTSPVKGTIYHVGDIVNATFNNSISGYYGYLYNELNYDGNACNSNYIPSLVVGSNTYEFTLNCAGNNFFRFYSYSDGWNYRSDTFRVVGTPSLSWNRPYAGDQAKWGSLFQIKWNSTSIVNAKIEYYDTIAMSWNTIVNSVPCIDGNNTFDWVVPNGTGTVTGFSIRITDVDQPSNTFTSGMFSIYDPQLTILSPVGGETYNAGQTISLTYNTTTAWSFVVYIYYKNNWNGLFWVYPSNTGTNVINLDIPLDAAGSDCKLRLGNEGDFYSDQMKNPFTVIASPPIIKLNSPGEGEYIQSGNSLYFSWVSVGVSRIDIFYSLNGGTDWLVLDTTMTTNNGYANFTAPAVSGVYTNTKIKISSEDGSVFGISKAFTLSNKPIFDIVSPTSSSVFTAGDQINIQYDVNNSYIYGYLRVRDIAGNYYLDNYLGQIFFGNYSFNWNSDLLMPTGQYFVEFYSNWNGQYYYGDTFTINEAPPSIIVRSPVGGRTFVQNTNKEISWVSKGIASVNIQQSIDGGASWTTVDAAIPCVDGANSYSNWITPPLTGENPNCLIRIRSFSPNLTGLSDQFTVTSLSPVKFIKPLAGTVVTQGDTLDIVIDNKGERVNDNGYFYVSTDGVNYNYIINFYSVDTGKTTLRWNVPYDIVSKTVSLRFNTGGFPDAYSTGVFEIKDSPPLITITEPHAGEVLAQRALKNISWSSKGANSVNINLSLDGGSSWSPIAKNYQSYNGNNNFAWKIPALGSAASNCLISVSRSSDSLINDLSDVFSITGPSQISFVNPKQGDVYFYNNAINIVLDNTGSPTNITLYYSNDNGGSYNSYSSYSLTTGLNTITIPAYTFNGLYKGVFIVRNNSNNEYTYSETFRLLGSPYVYMYDPRYWYQGAWGRDMRVSWYSNNLDKAKIQLYNPVTASYITMADSFPCVEGENIFYWQIPEGTGTVSGAFVTITDIYRPEYTYNSEGFIISEPILKLISPSGGETFNAGQQVTITYNTTDYSYIAMHVIADGKELPDAYYIYPNNIGQNTYQITLQTNAYGDSCYFLLMHQWNNDPLNTAKNKYAFTINPPPPQLRIRMPNSSSFLSSGQPFSLEWESFGTDTIDVDYSINGGSTFANFATVVSHDNSYNFANLTAPVVSGVQANSKLRISNKAKTLQSVSDVLTISDAPRFEFINPTASTIINAGNNLALNIVNHGPQTYNINIFYEKVGGGNSGTVTNIYYVYNGTNTYNWLTSTGMEAGQYRIVISDQNENNYYSDAFTVNPAPPSLSIVSPSSSNYYYTGNWSGIYWNSVNVDSVIASYSINNGTTWNLINNYPSLNGTRNDVYFQIPDVGGTFKNSKIKVEMKGNPSVSSVSQAFTMSSVAPDSFITPSAGSTIVAGTTINIVFDNKGEILSNQSENWSDPNSGLNLSYSTDSGNTWNIILPLNKLTKGINSCSWTVPEGMQSSSNFVIRLAFWGNNWGQVKLNLQAAPPTISVISPALNDYIISGDYFNLVWHSINVPLVDIQYSIDGGLTYNNVERGVVCNNGDNYYSTSFTQVGTNTKYKFRVASSDETVIAYSELFTVSNRIPVIIGAPAGGEMVQAGSEMLINFKFYPLSTNTLLIRAISDNGYYYNVESKEYTKGTYSAIWKTDELTGPSSSYKIAIGGYFAGKYIEVSSNYFTVLPAPPRLEVQYPSAGQILWAGYSASIQYYAVNVPDVDIYQSTDSGSTWQMITANRFSNNGYNYLSWTPNIPFGQIDRNCFVKVFSSADSTVSSISAEFTINNEAPVYTITSPKKGDVYQAGNYYTCAYTSTAKNDYFNFSLSVDTGKHYFPVSPYSRSSVYGTDAFSFYIPDTIQAKTKCIVKMQSQSGSPTGLSDTFAITPATPYIYINQPNDQSWWIIGDSVNVTWYSRNIGAVKIQLSIDAGKTWAPITSSVTSKNGDNKYKFKIQLTQTASKYAIIKVASLDGKNVATSTMFNIASGAPYFSIVLPKGGETFRAGQYINFVFDNNGPSTPAGIQITYDGLTWMPLSNNNNGNYISTGRKTFSIQIPENAPASIDARFRIYDMDGNVGKGESGGPETTMLVTLADTSEKFSITELAPYITVTEPGLNWIYYSGSNYSKVAWRSVHVNTVSIEYSSDNQASWTNLGNYQSYDGDNSANPYFVLPDLYSENCYYRITDVEKDTIVGLSQRFTTSNKPDTLFFYTPGGGEIVNAGSNLNISYLYQGRYRESYRFDIYYSPDGGLNRMYIGNLQLNWGVSNLQWNLPWYLESTSNAVIIIEDYSYNATPFSMMSKPFTVVAAQPYINVQNPSSGDYWVTGKYYPIYWSSIKVPSFDVSLTPDGGKTWITVADSLFNNNITMTAPVVAMPTDSAQIRVSASDSSLIAFSSYFTLSNVDPYVQITAPANGDKYYARQTSKLKFMNNGPAIRNGIKIYLLDGNTGTTTQLYLNNNYGYFNKGLNEVEFWFPETIYGTDKARLILKTGKEGGNPTSGEIELVDTSDGFFTVVPAPPTLYMERPDAGSYFLGGSVAEIAWYDVNVGEVKLEFSDNSGVDWTTIANSITSSNGMNYYSWTVPDVSMENSNNLMRITSTANSTIYSVSQTFTISNIAPRLILSSPNGLENWKAGNSYYVEFDYTGNTAYQAELAVSSDAGYTWQTVNYIYKIEKGKNFFLWDIPIYQEATPYYLMRIALDAQTFDVSDTTFTIEPGNPEISINRPTADNGYLVSGNWDNISWNSALVEFADVDYSLDGGATWISVFSSYPCYNGNNGIGWTLPAVNGVNGNAMIRIKDSSDPSIYALSNFTLSDRPGYITIIKPDTTTSWTAGNYQTVDFSSVGLPLNKPVRIILKYNNRELWLNEQYNVQPGMNSYGFTLSDTLSAANNAQVVITATSNGTAGSTENISFFSNKFAINAAAPSLALNYPSTGSYLIKGDKVSIYWYNVNAGRVNIDFSSDNGATWTTIKSGFNGKNGYNSFEWIVPDLNITTAKIKITSLDVAGVETSSGSFTIFNGVVSIVLESPNGGETFNVGGTFKVRYNYNGGYSPIMLTFSSDSGLTWQPIEDAIISKPGENVYSTNIPYDASTSDNCLVSVADDRGNVDVSNAVFAIAPAIPAISVYQPKFGDRLMSGATYPVSWYSLSVPFVNIAYSQDSAKSWNKVVDHLPVFNIANTYNWSVPDTITGTNFSYIRVSNDDTVQGISELFTISSEAISFKVLQPNGGETILAETWQSIKFNYNGNNNLAVNLFISIDAGATWKQITNLANSTALPGENTFNVYIPYNLVSTQCKIRIQSATNPSLFDVSDGVFTIEGVDKSLLVTAPKAHSYLISGSSANIEWNSYNLTSVKIEYSTDSAKTWNDVKNSVLSHDGKNVFNWTIPTVDTVRRFSFVKISDVGIESISDMFTLSDRYPSSDARLASLTVGGAEVDSFSSLKYNYTYYVTYSTKLPPALGGTPVDTFARISVTNSTVVPGTSFVDVTAEDGVTKKHYEVSFVKMSASNEAYLSSISLNGVPISGFQSGTYNYSFFYNYYDAIPVATATATSVGARVDITPATAIPGAITIVVTAESDTVWNTYTVNLTTNLPPSLSDATFSIDENTQNLTTVGTVTASNDKPVTIRYALLSNGGGAFKLFNNQGGVIQVNNFTLLNYEATPTFALKLRVYEITDPVRLADTATITVNLNNVNDMPTFSDQTIRITENQSNNSEVGTISVIDEDLTHNYSFLLAGASYSGLFDIDYQTGAIILLDSAKLNYAAFDANGIGNPVQLFVELFDDTFDMTATVSVNVLMMQNKAITIPEIPANGTVVSYVGDLDATEGEGGRNLTYSIVSGNTNNAFQINPTSGIISVLTPSEINYEIVANRTFNLGIQISDDGTPSIALNKIVPITITDVNDPPVTSDQILYVFSYSLVGDSVGRVVASDQDAGDDLTYAITEEPVSGVFQIDQATGMITVKAVKNLTLYNYFDLKVTITDNGLPGTTKLSASAKIRIIVSSGVIADFSFTLDGNDPKKVTFTNKSSVNATDFYWTFGDGTQFSGKSVLHSYSSEGLYSVCLQVFDSKRGLSNKVCKDVLIGEPRCIMKADFSYVINGNTVTLTDNSAGAIEYYYWNLGDNTTYTSQNPVHTYAEAGYYLVSLSVSDSLKGCMDYYADMIQVGTVDCHADFSYTIDTTLQRGASFKNNSEGTLANFFWDFDDGKYSIEENPTHLFRKDGIYQVSLTVSNSNATCMDVMEIPVQIGNVGCDAGFSYTVVGDSVYFMETSLGTSTQVLWSFGDGRASITHDPAHRYKYQGFYTVGLNTYNRSSRCMDYKEQVILVGDPGKDCEADFMFQVDPASMNVKFTDKSSGNIDYYIWNYGDKIVNTNLTEKNPNHTYTKSGYYNVCLTVINTQDVSNITCKQVGVINTTDNSCQANFDFNIDNMNVVFYDNSLGSPDKFEWNYGDQTTGSTLDTSHTYAASGYYLVSLKITNTTSGCTDKTYKMLNINKNDLGLKAGFGFDALPYSKKAGGYPVDFIGAGCGDQARLQWSFGDGESDTTTSSPTHSYDDPGTYWVCYTVSDPVTGEEDEVCDSVTTEKSNEVNSLYSDVYDIRTAPNPFDNLTTISFSMANKSMVELAVFDLNGKRVTTILKTTKDKGVYSVKWDGAGLQSGSYILQFRTANSVSSRMIVKK